MRYNPITQTWVNAGITKEGEDYAALNIKSQTGIVPSGDKDADNTAFINWRVADFKAKISNYYNVNDVLYCMAFLKMIAAADNRCKNTYEYLDPITLKICMAQDDLDTIFLTDNVGRKTKPYYVEEHDKNGSNFYWNGEDNVFYNLMEQAFSLEYKAMMKTILDKMASTEFGGSAQECLDRYFFSIQKYFPSVAFNETARLLYEEASVKQASGEYKNGTPAITQSLGDQLQAEMQWWKRRLPYLQSLASSNPFYVRSKDSLGFRSVLTTASGRPSYTFDLIPWQWLYPKIGVGQSMGADTTRVKAKETYKTSTINTDGNTDTFIYGANYYTSFGEFADKSIGETFELSGERLLEFSADSRKISGTMQFRPIAMKVSCPNLRKLTLYGVSTLAGNLNLSGCSKLEAVDLRGTNLNTVVFPATSTLKEISIPNVSSLSILGCQALERVYFESLSNMVSITTDNSVVFENVITNAANLNEVHLQGINYNAGEQSELVYNLLLNDNTTASGIINLNKALTIDEKNALVQKYGNIDDKANSLYITYPLVSQNSISISGDSSITQGTSKEYKVSYEGNDFISVEWSVTNAEFKANGSSCMVKAAVDATANIVIRCQVNRIDKDALIATKTITIDELVKISSISVANYDVYAVGNFTLPISYNPSNYSVQIHDIKAVVSTNEYVSVESVDKDNVVLNCRKLVTNRAASVNLNVEVTDNIGNVVNTTATINIYNPIKNYYVEGKDLASNPKVTSKVTSGGETQLSITAGEGTDDWYVDSVSSSSADVTAKVVEGYGISLLTNDSIETTITVNIKCRNRQSEMNYTFTWITVIDFNNLCFTSTGDSTVALQPFSSNSMSGAVANLFISKNGGEWTEWDYSAVSLADGEKLEVYGTEFRNLNTYSRGYKFVLQGKIKVSGDLVALNNGSSVMNSYQYASLFKESIGLYDAADLVLPKKVGDNCYIGMFNGCKSLVNAPKLPTITLADSCYEGMFQGCTSLENAPDLPATTLASECYRTMFYKCISLTKAPQLLATNLGSSCYEGMFQGCTSLENAPVLPATTLVPSCYNYMFRECSKLNYVKALFTDNTASNCIDNWLKEVASSGTFVKNAAATWNVVGASGVPEGWTVQTVTV